MEESRNALQIGYCYSTNFLGNEQVKVSFAFFLYHIYIYILRYWCLVSLDDTFDVI